MKKTTHFRLFSLFMLAIAMLSMQGCALMFSSRYQKVNFHNGTAGATITYPEKGYRLKGSKHKFDKCRVFHTVAVSKEGYKSTQYPFQINKRSATMAFTALNIVIPLYGWIYGIPLDLRSPKTRKFDKEQNIPKLLEYEKRKADEKYVLINNTAFDAKGTDIKWHNYLSIYRYMDGNKKDTKSTKKYNKSKDKEDVKIDNTIFTEALNGTMKELNFIDTTHTIFPSVKNTIYLDATVKKITFHHIESRVTRNARQSTFYQPNTLLSVEMTIVWYALDYYKQKVDSFTTTKKSDLFAIPYTGTPKERSQKIIDIVGDNLEYSLLEVRKSLSEKGLLSTKAGTEAKRADITIAKPQIAPATRMNELMKSGVTIKVDEGHGSGVIISEDGYIITAYHVIAGSKSMEVTFNDGTKAQATVVRTSTEADLALLKVTNTGLQPLPLNSTEPEIGIDVWAIGTPKSVELGQSVSKGILSGIRKANDVSYLQTDVSLNGGNSGGALITKEGTVLGIVTSKLIGLGTEGVGFAISSQEVLSRLNITYK